MAQLMASASVVVSIAASFPRVRLPRSEIWSGHRFELARLLTIVGGGIFTALLIWLQERYLWAWTTWLRLVTDEVFRAWNLDKNLAQHRCSRTIRILAVILRSLWFYYVSVYVTEGMRLLINTGATKFAPAALSAWIVYLLSDCPPGKEQAIWISQFDVNIGYFLFTYGVYRPLQLYKVVRVTMFWLVVLITNWISEWNGNLAIATAVWGFDASAIIGPIIDWLPKGTHLVGRVLIMSLCSILLRKLEFRSFRKGSQTSLSRIPSLVLLKLSMLLEIYEYAEALLCVYVPRWIERQLYQRQKRDRLVQGVQEYEFIRLKPDEIRLLILKKASFPLSGTLEAEVIEVPLAMAPPYEALSYRWDDQTLGEEILANSQILRITKSAFEVLLAYRSALTDRVVWIDAICINQLDQEEKGEQIQVMSKIYSSASKVIVFPFCKWSARLAVPLIYQYGLGPPAEPLNAQVKNLVDLMVEGRPSFAPRWEAMARILSHEYFNRAWIVQEIAVAKQVYLSLGGIYVPWDVFYRAVLMLQNPLSISKMHNNHFQPPTGMLKFHCVYFLSMLRSDSAAHGFGIYRTHEECTTLESVLYLTATFQSTDPRDKVYAILGVVNEQGSNLTLRPDYSQSPEKVFEAVAHHLFCGAERPSVNILTFAGYGYPEEGRLRQSWIPQLLQPRTRIPFTNLIVREYRFQASGNTLTKISEGALPGSLCIDGNICDMIYAIAPVQAPRLLSTARFTGPNHGETIAVISYMNAAIAFTHVQMLLGHVRPQGPIRHALSADCNPTLTEEDFLKWITILQYYLDEDDRKDIVFTPDPTSKTPNQDKIDFEARQQKPSDKRLSIVHEALNTNPGFLTFLNNVCECCDGRRFGITRRGRLCLVPPLTGTGDTVFIPFGAQTPYIISSATHWGRPEGCYTLVGEAYVQGVMKGEAMNEEMNDWRARSRGGAREYEGATCVTII